MPLYDYRCEACQTEFTELQPMSAPGTGTRCPNCGSTDTRRKMSTFASQSGASGGAERSGGGCLPSG